MYTATQESDEEKARQEFYRAIGYSEDEEYFKFPKEVLCVIHYEIIQ